MLTSGVFGYLFDYVIWWLLYFSLLIHTWCFFRFFPSTRRTAKLIGGNVFIFFCLLGAAALAGETYLRFVAVRTDAFGMSLPARRWFALHTQLNSLGCRDKEWEQRKPREIRRIAFIGDSFTYGWGIEDPADRFPDLLQVRFDSKSKGAVEVMNVAKPGWGTGDEIQPVIDMVESYGVDEVVLCHVPNDIEKLLPISEDFNPIRPPSPQWIDIDSSPLLDYLYRRIYLPRVPTVRGYHDWLAEGYADPTIWGEHRRRLERMAQFCRERGVVFRVALLPFLRTQGTKFDQQKIHDQLRQQFEGDQVPVIDLLDVIRNRDAADLVVNSVDPHPNEVAHRLFADRLWKFWQSPDP